MTAELLGARIEHTLAVAGITPRDLSAICKIHWTAIYSMIRNKDSYVYRPVTVDVLSATLDKIDMLVADRRLPITDKISASERQGTLLSLLQTI